MKYQIGEHLVTVPDAPTKPLKIQGLSGFEWTIPLEELIIGMDEPYENAFWKRQELPKYFERYIPDGTKLNAEETVWEDGALMSLSEDDTRELIYLFDREMHRRVHGVWFKNGNDITYLTNHHYAFLQWIKPYGLTAKLVPSWRPIGYEYAEYREFQRDIFYLIYHVNNDPDILGLFVAKPKKTGITQCFSAYYLNKGTITRMMQMGVMSKGRDAETVNMLMIIHGYDSLPPIFQPVLKFRADKAGDLFFGEPALRNVSSKAGKQRRQKLMNAKPLNTRLWAAATKAAGFDSPTMTDIWFDEFPKYDTENNQEPEIVFTRNQETVKIQDIFNGRIWITSYPPETDTKGFHQAKKIYFDSAISTIKDGEKRTRTGLIKHYVSTVLSYTSTFDKYGKCDEVEAQKRNQAERNKVRNDKKAFQAKIRQYSESEEECWATSGAGSVFDNLRLGQLLLDLEKSMRSKRFYRDGRFRWKNELWETSTYDQRPKKQFCEVIFEEVPEAQTMEGITGRFRMYRDISPSEKNIALQQGRDEFGNLLRPRIITKVGGVDPTDYAAASEVIQGSKNASFTMNLPDSLLDSQLRTLASKVILGEYFFRADLPDETYEDIVKEIVFFGKVVIVEANKKWMATRLIQDGLGRYMIVKQKSTGKFVFWDPKLVKVGKDGKVETDYSLISTERPPTGGAAEVNSDANTNDLETIVRLISKYIIKPKAEEVGRIFDYGSTITSERLLDQLMKFSKENVKFFDLVVAFGLTLLCMEIVMQPQEIEQWNQDYAPELVNALFEGFMVN